MGATRPWLAVHKFWHSPENLILRYATSSIRRRLEIQLNTELQAQQKTNTMIPISSFELAVLEQGIEQGKRNKAQEAVLDVLETRFGEISDLVREQVQSLTDAIELKRLHRRAILVSDLDSFSAELVMPVG